MLAILDKIAELRRRLVSEVWIERAAVALAESYLAEMAEIAEVDEQHHKLAWAELRNVERVLEGSQTDRQAEVTGSAPAYGPGYTRPYPPVVAERLLTELAKHRRLYEMERGARVDMEKKVAAVEATIQARVAEATKTIHAAIGACELRLDATQAALAKSLAAHEYAVHLKTCRLARTKRGPCSCGLAELL